MGARIVIKYWCILDGFHFLAIYRKPLLCTFCYPFLKVPSIARTIPPKNFGNLIV